MENRFSDLTETALIAERSAILAESVVDEKKMHLLENEAMQRLESFLSGKTEIDPDDAPMFYSFIKVFGETENPDLRLCAKKAEAKITPVLKQFDQMIGYENLAKITAEEIERNLADLDRFEKIDPFEKEDSGHLVLKQFEQVLRVLDEVEIVDDETDDMSKEATETFKETVVETAKIKTYMRLCVSDHEITREEYLDRLLFEMEKALVILFVMDKSAQAFPLDKAHAETVHQEFEKLLDVLE